MLARVRAQADKAVRCVRSFAGNLDSRGSGELTAPVMLDAAAQRADCIAGAKQTRQVLKALREQERRCQIRFRFLENVGLRVLAKSSPADAGLRSFAQREMPLDAVSRVAFVEKTLDRFISLSDDTVVIFWSAADEATKEGKRAKAFLLDFKCDQWIATQNKCMCLAPDVGMVARRRRQLASTDDVATLEVTASAPANKCETQWVRRFRRRWGYLQKAGAGSRGCGRGRNEEEGVASTLPDLCSTRANLCPKSCQNCVLCLSADPKTVFSFRHTF